MGMGGGGGGGWRVEERSEEEMRVVWVVSGMGVEMGLGVWGRGKVAGGKGLYVLVGPFHASWAGVWGWRAGSSRGWGSGIEAARGLTESVSVARSW